MSISIKDRKILWSKSAGRCAFPNCKFALSSGGSGKISIVGEEAHIVGRETTEGSPRGNHFLPVEQRDGYDNLILLCPTHHSVIDKNPDEWSVEKIQDLKKSHESWVVEKLNDTNENHSLSPEEVVEKVEHILRRGSSIASKIELARIKENLPLYVTTPQHAEGVRLLMERSSLIISGDPGSGKTMLAHQLAFNFIHLNEAQFIVLNEHDELKSFYEQFDENRPQVFLFDDFLGASVLSSKKDHHYATKLIGIFDSIKSTPQHYFILTTRNYILQEARQQFHQKENKKLDYFDFPILLKEYSRKTKFEILISHLRFHKVHKKAILSLLEKYYFLRTKIVLIVDHENYFPRLIESAVISSSLDEHPDGLADDILESLKNPREIYQKVYEKLEPTSQALMVVLASFPSSALVSRVCEAYMEFRKRMGGTSCISAQEEFEQALRILDGFMITTDYAEDQYIIGFKNPSIREFAKEHLTKSSSWKQLVTGSIFVEQAVTLAPFIKNNTEEATCFIKNIERISDKDNFCPRNIKNSSWSICKKCPLHNYSNCKHDYDRIQFLNGVFKQIPVSSSSKIYKELISDAKNEFFMMNSCNFIEYGILLYPENISDGDVDRAQLFIHMIRKLNDEDNLNDVIEVCHYPEIFTNPITKMELKKNVQWLVDNSADFLRDDCDNESEKEDVIYHYKKLKENYLESFEGKDREMIDFLEDCITRLQEIEKEPDEDDEDYSRDSRKKDTDSSSKKSSSEDISQEEMVEVLQQLANSCQ